MQPASDSDAAIKPAAAESGRGWLLQSLHAHFPDARTRYSFIIAFLLALAASVYWLVDTIESKWLYDISHPVQAVSFDTASRLPALFGLLWLHVGNALQSVNVTLVHRVIPVQFAVNVRQGNVHCDSYPYNPPFVLCQQTQDNGQPVLNPASAPGELNGASGLSFDVSSFPLQFVDGVQNPPTSRDVIGLCYQSHLLYNTTAAFQQDPNFAAPEVLAAWLTPDLVLALNELAAAGRTNPGDPAVSRVINADGNTLNQRIMTYLNYDTLNTVLFDTTQFIEISGQSRLQYGFSKIRSQPRPEPRLVEQGFRWLLNFTDDPAERQRLIALRADPSMSYRMATMCMQPASFVVKEARAVRLYGLGSFLSDLGGFVNLLTIALLLLFPLTLKVTQPRSVLPLWLVERWKSGKTHPHPMSASSGGPATMLQDLLLTPEQSALDSAAASKR